MESEQTLVNGNLMKKYVGKSIRLYLKVENVSSGGRQVDSWTCEISSRCHWRIFFVYFLQVQGITTDKKTISLKLDQPLNQPLSGYIEVFGEALSQDTVNCSEVRKCRGLLDQCWNQVRSSVLWGSCRRFTKIQWTLQEELRVKNG
jgi:hypothetical protein